MELGNDRTKKVRQVFRDMLKDPQERVELSYLIGQAEETDAFTHVAALGFLLAGVLPDPSARADSETAEQYVQRVLKFMISRESQKGTAEAVESLMSSVSDLRGTMSLDAALKQVVLKV